MTEGIAYGFFKLHQPISEVETNIRATIANTADASLLHLVLKALDDTTSFPSTNGHFAHELHRARNGNMDYVLQATLPGVDNAHAATRLRRLVLASLQDTHDQGVCYEGADGRFRYLNPDSKLPQASLPNQESSDCNSQPVV